MDGTGVKAIADLQHNAEETRKDLKPGDYIPDGFRRVNEFDPRQDCFRVYTLGAVVEYIKSGIEDVNPKDLIIVCDWHQVIVYENFRGETKKRTEIIEARNPEDSITFGRHMSVEEFCIFMRTHFEDTLDRDKVIAHVSKIKIENGIETTDDGISQKVSVKKGISGGMTQTAVTPAINMLQPFRTFREIIQPESEFLLRIQDDGRGNALCVLFESDGNAWKIEARKRVAEYIKENLGGVEVGTILS
jgi:hypothetical protein